MTTARPTSHAAHTAQPRDPEAFGGNLVVACSRFARTAAQAIDVEVSTTMWRTLSNLAHSDEGLSVTELAMLERTSQPTMSKLIKRLDHLTLVTRSADPDDRRSTRITLTDAGSQALAGYRRSLTTALAPHLGSLSPEDNNALNRAVEILTRLTTQVADAGPLAQKA